MTPYFENLILYKLETSLYSSHQWPLWKKILFRFFFIYLILLIAPWTVIGNIPGLQFLSDYYSNFIDWSVRTANAVFFHIRPKLVPEAGSGDTSWGWAEQWLYTITAIVGCLVWSILDRKRPNYSILNYWNCLFIRYSLAAILFSYGISKLLVMQMPFPSLSAFATPLGDYTPMRFFWLLMGYSKPYEFFSGVMEVLAAIFLFYRRTATLGTLLAFIIFVNIAMLNLGYDICVKLFSIQLVINCIVLMANEKDRIINFLFRNKIAIQSSLYIFPYSNRRMRITRIVIKLFFVVFVLGPSLLRDWKGYNTLHTTVNIAPLKMGVYDVAVLAVNKDTIPAYASDTSRWRDFILDARNSGSIGGKDSSFRVQYGRSYFNYSVDSAKNLLVLKKSRTDSLPVISFQYRLADENTLLLFGKHHNDSLFLRLHKSPKQFQLRGNEFHWLMESVP